MRKIQIFIYFGILAITLQSCKINNAFEALEVYNYFKAKKLFEKKVDNKIVAAPYGLSLIYGRNDNPFYNLDSAYKFIYMADSNWTKLNDKQKEKLQKHKVDSLSVEKWKDSIDVKRFEIVNKAQDLNLVIQYIQKHPQSIRLPQAIRLRDSLAFVKANKENTSLAFEEFLQNYPNAEEALVAQNRYEKLLFEERTASNQLEDYRTFVEEHPQSPFVGEAQDSIYFKSTASRTIEAYYNFINQNPENPHINEAWRKLYELYMINYSPERIAEFRIDYPDYPFVDELMMDIELARKTFLPFKSDGAWGFIDLEGNVMIEPQFQSVENFNEGLALVVKEGKVGFIDKSGQVVVPLIYEDAESFQSSLAIVAKDDYYGIIDRTNKVILPLEYDFVGRFYDGLALVANDTAYGYTNKSGEIIIPITLDYAGDFQNGLALVEQNSLKGFINTQGRVVVPIEYKWLEPFQQNGLARAKKDSLFGLINQQSTVVLPFEYDAIGEFSNHLALVAKEGKYGYVNDSAQLKVESNFDFRRDALNWGKFEGNYAKYMLKEKFGIIDTSGKRVFPAIFENIGDYNDSNYIAVKKNGKWGYTNQELSLVIPYQYNFAESFVDTLAKVKLENYWGLIDKEGEQLLENEFDDIQITSFGFIVEKDGLKGILNPLFQEIIPFLYDKIELFSEDILLLEKGESLGYYKISETKYIGIDSGDKND